MNFTTNTRIIGSGVDHTVNKGWVIFESSAEVCLYNIPSPVATDVDIRSQNPIGTDVTSRVIRIADPHVGAAKVVSDATYPAGSTAVPCRSNINYVEIAILNDGKVDFRGFDN